MEISVSDSSNLSDVVQAMNNSIFDYVVFNRKTGTIEEGNYQKRICQPIEKFLLK